MNKNRIEIFMNEREILKRFIWELSSYIYVIRNISLDLLVNTANKAVIYAHVNELILSNFLGLKILSYFKLRQK